jgi:glycosyltransferase involved in cell wall biosynthesis
MSLSICVCARNAERSLGACLDALVDELREVSRADRSVDILVVEHLSTDRTLEIAYQHGLEKNSKVTVSQSKSATLPGARNDAWRIAHGDWIAFVDADCIPNRGWIGAALAEISKWERAKEIAAVVGATSTRSENGRKTGLSIALESYVGGYGSPLNKPVSKILEQTHAPSLNVIYRRSALETVGGFREIFDCSGEDVDLSFRFQEMGWKAVSAPSLKLIHCQRTDWVSWASKMVRYGRGRTRLAFIHPKRWEWKFAAPLSVVGFVLACVLMRTWGLMALYPLSIALAMIPSALAHRAKGLDYVHAVAVAMISHIAYGLGMLFEAPLWLLGAQRRLQEESLSCSQS